ncbi:helix-turn-helix domain-containing protein [Flavobacterium turcicum]|uniref:AAA family ATPase n=1 Tax=Flavobacterium turcicum TaxID=2764718 RepID=A0ABR7JBS2_9FLAO|nr:helix-turn-helix domain-containing protein [Flavobacterium turcicum]MBC5861942.1 AAA family ATPase [Flavobacterium turcicum]NHL00673.1 AAA family ATPase [Flavobacterium turcicum]
MQTISEAASYTLRFINQTQRSVFLTGKAGTGKTTLLREIIQTTHKNTVVVAPTGIAALNAGGVTIHSMFQLPFGGFIPDNSAPQFSESTKFETKATLRRHFKMSGLKKAVIRNMELLVIDEVSMLRADLLDAMDFMMQTVRKKNLPFGGVQVLYIGDLLQLPPVIRDEEWSTLKNYYRGKFFFHSHVIQQHPPLYIELSKIFRQTDDAFISVLNNLRNNQITQQDLQTLNQFVKPDFDLKANKGYITLTTHNHKADAMNAQALADLKGELITYKPEITGDFPDKIYPVEQDLKLKVGAQIMFVKNDLSFDKHYFNGKMGVIKSLASQEILVHFPEENKTIEVEKYEWQNIRYKVDPATKEIEEEVLGTFVHYPIKLAWAITVHKSQGLTFDKAALDVSQVFLPGQAYVALSRLRSLNGLVLLSALRMNGISNDQDVMDYANNKASEDFLANALHFETKNFIHQYLVQSFDWNDVAQEWRNHRFSYNEDAQNSEKSKHALWAKKQASAMDELLAPSQKFIKQLHSLFSQETADLNHIAARVQAAYSYFFKSLDDLVFEILWKIEEVKRSKKAKTFFDELTILEEMQTKTVLRLMKAKLLIEIVVAGETISKENLSSSEIKSYISRKTEAIQKQFKELNVTLIDDEKDLERYTSKKGKTTVPKKSTVQETYELWVEKKSIEDIAAIRVLTKQTICGHFVKLIQAKAVAIHELLPEDKLQDLAAAFAGYKEESLNVLMEQHGTKFSWDEARMYKASLN